MGVFDGLRNAKVFERGVFISKAGSFKVRVDKILTKDTRKSGNCFIVEQTVLETSCADYPVGSKVTWLQKLTDKDVAFSALKPFFYACLGLRYPEDKVKIEATVDPVLEQLADDAEKNGTLNGKVLNLQTSMIVTKEKKQNFTVHNWTPGG